MIYLSRLVLFGIVFFSGTINTARQNIALCTVATGKYACFVKGFVESARKNFLSEHNVKYIIFTDQTLPIEGDDIIVVNWPHKKWPFSTMMRFKAYHDHSYLFDNMDYAFAYDVDALFVRQVGDEILGESVAVLHPGYYKKNLVSLGLTNDLIEKNSNSAVFLSQVNAGKEYFAGGFYGGKAAHFKEIVSKCYETVNKDLARDIIAAWHDETHLNYYFLRNPPQIKLTPSYCYPEGIDMDSTYKNIKNLTPIITVLNKEHARMRSNERFLDDREFVVLIPSYNNINYYQENLNSVYNQSYKKYRVIYVDDHSSDGTGEFVNQYVRSLGKENITTIIRNTDRKLAMANIYNSIHDYCLDHEIVVMLDGDDALAGPDTLAKLNDEYKKEDIWFTYGNCWFSAIKRACPWSKKIDDKNIELNRFREWNGAATHLRSFYAWLFKKIKKEDLMTQGDFFKMTYDVAMFMPMLEMSGYHHKFIEDILYCYNDQNPLNDHKVNGKLQLDLNRYIRNNLIKYQPVTKLDYFNKVLRSNFYDGEVCIEEVAAVLNDFIANVYNIYPDEEASKILSKIVFLEKNFANRFELIALANSKSYNFLASYLVINNIFDCIDYARKNKIINNSVLEKHIYYFNDLIDNSYLDDYQIRFTQWLGQLISKRYGLPVTTIVQDICKVNVDGMTPLLSAAAAGLPDMVKGCLSFGANKNCKNREGKCAADFVRGRIEPWFLEIIKILSN